MINNCIHSQPLLLPNSVHCQNLPRRVFGRCSSSSWSSWLGCCRGLFSIKYLSTLVPLRTFLKASGHDSSRELAAFLFPPPRQLLLVRSGRLFRRGAALREHLWGCTYHFS